MDKQLAVPMPSSTDNEEGYEVEEINYSEQLSGPFKELSDRIAKRTLDELEATSKVTFDPSADVKRIDELIAYYTDKLATLSSINPYEWLREEQRFDAVTEVKLASDDDDDSFTTVNLTERLPAKPRLKEYLHAEKELHKMIDSCKEALVELTKERRLLTNQPYGQPSYLGNQMTRLLQARRLKVPGAKPTIQLPQGTASMSRGQEVLMHEPIVPQLEQPPRPLPTQDYAPKDNYSPHLGSDRPKTLADLLED